MHSLALRLAFMALPQKHVLSLKCPCSCSYSSLSLQKEPQQSSVTSSNGLLTFPHCNCLACTKFDLLTFLHLPFRSSKIKTKNTWNLFCLYNKTCVKLNPSTISFNMVIIGKICFLQSCIRKIKVFTNKMPNTQKNAAS